MTLVFKKLTSESSEAFLPEVRTSGSQECLADPDGAIQEPDGAVTECLEVP